MLHTWGDFLLTVLSKDRVCIRRYLLAQQNNLILYVVCLFSVLHMRSDPNLMSCFRLLLSPYGGGPFKTSYFDLSSLFFFLTRKDRSKLKYRFAPDLSGLTF